MSTVRSVPANVDPYAPYADPYADPYTDPCAELNADLNADPRAVAGVAIPPSRVRAAAHATARWAGGAVLVGHGLIHLMGVALLWRLGQPGELRYADVSPVAGSTAALAVGLLWLISAALFVLAGGLLVAQWPRWRTVAFAAAVVSVPVLLPSASIVPTGLAVDAIVLLAVITIWKNTKPRLRT